LHLHLSSTTIHILSKIANTLSKNNTTTVPSNVNITDHSITTISILFSSSIVPSKTS